MTLLVFYTVFSYLFMAGSWLNNRDAKAIVWFLSPITFPFVLGAGFTKNL